MTGEKNLGKLLATLSPMLIEGEFVFCSFENARYGDYAELEPIASVSESEGLTVVISRAQADQNNLNYTLVFRGISLKVHSSLEAVGLTAALSTRLAEHGISANVIAGYYHDHVFVQSELAEKAIQALVELGSQ
ncbi:MAG: ACT domain-containing protein [Gammaproteobacteria bacterium]|nr:ACT domain-containing protein [Gammaproteobacteria bacterium]